MESCATIVTFSTLSFPFSTATLISDLTFHEFGAALQFGLDVVGLTSLSTVSRASSEVVHYMCDLG